MKKINVLIMLFLLTSCASKGIVKKSAEKLREYSGPKRRVAVTDFQVKTAYGKTRLGSSASDIMVTELFNTGRFILIEREKIAKIIEEQTLGASGIIDSSTAVEIGKMLGAGTMITGSVSQFGVKTTGSDYLVIQKKKQTAEAVVDVRVVDVASGRIIYTGTGKGVTSKKTGTVLGIGTSGGYDETLEGGAMREAIIDIINDIVKKISTEPWTCKVVEIEGPDVYINAGELSNIIRGTRLTVIRKGKEVRNEDGTLIGTIDKEAGVIEVKEHFGKDGSIAKVIEGDMPERGDICKLK